jgi:hypothetical protein
LATRRNLRKAGLKMKKVRRVGRRSQRRRVVVGDWRLEIGRFAWGLVFAGDDFGVGRF